eukprot:Gb_02488 [translate_table: standard]
MENLPETLVDHSSVHRESANSMSMNNREPAAKLLSHRGFVLPRTLEEMPEQSIDVGLHSTPSRDRSMDWSMSMDSMDTSSCRWSMAGSFLFKSVFVGKMNRCETNRLLPRFV